MINFIKKLFTKNNPQSVGVTTYPDKILFVTQHQIKNSYWTSSAEIVSLDHNVSNEIIGKTIIRQLSLSKYGIKMPSEKEHREIIDKQKKADGFKSVKESMKDSKYIGILRRGDKIIFQPTSNGGSTGKSRGYSYLNKNLEINSNADFENLGKMYRKALERCELIEEPQFG